MNIKNLEVKTITPEYAKYLLENNYKNNRKVHQTEVEKYARDMKNGKWITGVYNSRIEPICISKKGELLDGQHRLLAIIEADKPIRMYIQKNMDEKSFRMMDNGIRRTVADALGNVDYSKDISALLKMVVATKYGDGGLGSILQGTVTYADKHPVRVTKQDILDEYNKSDKDHLVDCVRKAKSIYSVVTKGSVATYAYFIWLVDWLQRNSELDEFIDGFKGTHHHNAQMCKTMILKQYSSLNGRKTNIDLLTYLLVAYEFTLKGKELEKFRALNHYIEKYNALIDSARNHD